MDPLDILLSSSALPSVTSDDVFSAYTYTGGTSTSQVTGVDTTAGGMVWLKARTTNPTFTSHYLVDSIRTPTTVKSLSTNSTAIESDFSSAFVSFNTNGFMLGGTGTGMNQTGVSYSALSFKKSFNFFDIVSYQGDGTSSRQIAHNLGTTPGLIIIKRRDGTTGQWVVYHRSIALGSVVFMYGAAATANINLNTTYIYLAIA